MKTTAAEIFASVRKIRERGPVVHNITNYVAMNNSANALLAIGASPVMAHAEEEVEAMVGIASALVVNIGTLSGPWIRAMFQAVHTAKARGIPIVLDPVGAGATPYRTRTALEMMRAAPPSLLRGNASEILAVAGERGGTKGVDSTEASAGAVEAARSLSRDFGSTVCVSGETDFIVWGEGVLRVGNGHILMTRVTALGCTASALCGAFAAVESSIPAAAAQAMAVMGIAGEMAAEGADGPGSLQVRFLDALYRLSERDIERRLKIEAG